MFQGGNTGKPEVGVSFAHPFANIVKSSNVWEVAQGAATDFTQDRHRLEIGHSREAHGPKREKRLTGP